MGGRKGKGFSGTSIKDALTNQSGVRSRVGGGDRWEGRSAGWKWRQLFLNNNKNILKIKIN